MAPSHNRQADARTSRAGPPPGRWSWGSSRAGRLPVAVIGFTIAGGRIAALNLVPDPAKLQNLTIQP